MTEVSAERRDPQLADALRARLASARRTAARGTPAIPARPDGDAPAPLSAAQARLWFLTHLDPESTAYQIPVALHLRGPLDRAALLGAVRDLVERHQVLRSLVVETDGEPMTVAGPADAVPLAEVDLTGPGGRESLDRRLRENLRRPFDLAVEPPVRATLLRLGTDEHVLALTVHHIAFDAWSRTVAVAELAALYSARLGQAEPPAQPPVQYADYAHWLSRRPEEAARAEADLTWWVHALSGLEPVLDLPTDRPRPPVADRTGAELPLVLPPALTAKVRRRAAEVGCTPFMVLLAVWQELLARLSGVDDVPVGVPEAGRRHPDTERTIGFFVNTLTMRTDLSGGPSGRELLNRVRDVALEAFARTEVPFERIVDRLRPARDLSTTPIFQVLLNVIDTPAVAPRFPGLAARVFAPPATTAKFDLNLAFTATSSSGPGDARSTGDTGSTGDPGGAHDAGDTYEGSLIYRTDLFERHTAQRITAWYAVLLDGVLSDLDRPVREVALEPVDGPLLSGPRREFDLTRPLHALVERWAAERPDATAVVGPDGELTYGQLDRRANRLAHRLLAAGVEPHDPVAVLADRRTPLVVALLATLKAGATYLPLDPAYPDDRLADILTTAGARVVLAEREFAGRGPGPAGAAPELLVIDDPSAPEGPPEQPGGAPGVPVDPAAPAYLIFTSGSTGRPKGVTVEHRQITHYLHAVAERLAGCEVAGGSFALVSTHAADLGLTNLFGALATGGTVHLVDREVATDPEAYGDYLEAHPVDAVKMVPSHLELLAAHGDLRRVLPRKLLVLAGEACSWDLVARIRTARPELAVQVHYGPTETTVSVLGCALEETSPTRRSGTVPIGRPLADVDCWVVDPDGRPLPVGVPGELWIGGPSVARGYFGRPDLTDERFVPDPVTGTARCYRSGDRVRLTEAGLFEFLGRVDDQVKIRGFRVELGEVATALRDLPELAEAVVLPVGEAHAGRLAAWVTPAGPASAVDVARVRTALRGRLPDYMVPSAIVVLPALPLNPNGKVDRSALPAPEPTAGTEHIAPSTPTELRVARAWAQVLDPGAADRTSNGTGTGISTSTSTGTGIGIDDDFFALGGDSFRAVRAVRAIDPTLRVIDLFTRPTVRELAAFLDAAEAGGPDGERRLLHRLAGPPPGRLPTVTVVCLPYGGGSAAAYGPLATELAGAIPGAAVLAVEPPGHDPARPDEPLLPLTVLIDRVVAELVERAGPVPSAGPVPGPVVVYGHCVGSAAATELALRLEAEGVPVTGLLVGGSFPGARLPGRLSTWLRGKFPATRWTSDRAYRDFLRTLGGIDDDGTGTGTGTGNGSGSGTGNGDGEAAGAAERTMLRALRHDVDQAQGWFTGELTRTDARRLRAPVLCVIGERDRSTELYEERFAEWGAFADRVELATLPRAGHYFLKHQAAQLAALVGERLGAWAGGLLPEPVADVTVVGGRARRDLRDFYLVAAGQTVSLIGSALTSFALGVWAYQRSGRVLDYALISMLAMLPAIVAGPLGGAVADRIDRRRVMLACDAVSATATASLVAALWGGSLGLGQVGLIVGVMSLVTAFRRPAYLAAVAQLVPKPYLVQANGLANLGAGLGTLIAPLAGGALIGLVGLPWVVAVDVASFLVGLAALLRVRFPDRLFRRREESFARTVAGGWRFLARRRPLLVMIVFFMVENYLGTLAVTLTVPSLLSFSGTTAVGVVTAVGGAGAVAGSLVVALWGGTARRATGMVGFVSGVGLGVVLVGLRPSVTLAAVGALVWWASMSILNAHWLAIIQLKVGPELQGRVLATNQMLAVAMTPLAFLTAPPLAERFSGLLDRGGPLAGTVGRVLGTGPGRGTGLLLVTCGLLLIVWAVLGLFHRPLRYMEDELPDAVAGAEIAEDLDTLQAAADRALPGRLSASTVLSPHTD
ncbi:non-ribosomal peptide synthetase [Kitasatospora purpeofusca]|uniref:non-ribosomal peptide synthetase/MFS transporter n=1 Tax=Kitasatospora purpeofusca TaxID=67352 RepID=UPI002A59CB3A|nr:non-ribosomal peptide synthetase [Kitasatospora purpeofusca]MDY0811383.1 amino acid adenylation domain-containing protein [Kitasatospora purpeofusca]